MMVSWMLRMSTAVALILTGLGVLTPRALAEPQVSGRQVYILRPVIDQIWGSYLFAVVNDTNDSQHLTIPVLLPEETADWRPEEGVKPEEVKLSDTRGNLLVEKDFAAGTNLMLFGFQVPAQYGEAKLTINVALDLDDVSFLSPPGELKMSAPNATFEENINFSGRNFDRLKLPALRAGERIQLTIAGIPEGRHRLWLIGSTFGVLLAAMASVLVVRTRPQVDSGAFVD